MSKLHHQNNSGISPDLELPRFDITVKSEIGTTLSNQCLFVDQSTYHEVIDRMESEVDQRINDPLVGNSYEKYLSIILDVSEVYNLISTLGLFGPFLLEAVHNDPKLNVLQITLIEMKCG